MLKKMVKLPKEMQKKEKSKPTRPQATKKREGQQFASRQMRRRMQQQGIEMDQIDATRVIIECQDKTLVIDQPEVVLMKQMGQEMYQIIGEAEEYSSGDFTIEEGVDAKSLEPTEEDFSKLIISENDVMLVAAQAKVDKEEANAALIDSDGDIAKAIIYLKNKP